MAAEKLFHVGVKALIEDEDEQVLLMKEDVSRHSLPTSEYWDFPGGRIQQGESPLDALRREVEEETGVEEIINPQFLTAVISNHEIKLPSGELVGLMLIVYKAKIASDAQVRLSDEHLGYDWLSKKEAGKLLEHKYPHEFTDLLK